MPNRVTKSIALAALALALALTIRVAASPSPTRAETPAAGDHPAVARQDAAQDRVAQHDVTQDDAAQDETVPKLYDDAVVRDMRITFEDDDWLALLQANGCRGGPGGGQPGGGGVSKDVPATLEVDGTRLERVGIRCKGNSSLGISGPKKPLNITLDAFEPGQDLWGFDVLNLNNNFNDASQLRDAVGLRLLANYMPISRFVFTKVTINGQYVGLYTMVEQINGEWSEHWFDDDGLIVRGDSPVAIAFESSTLNWKGEDLAPYKQGYEVKGKNADSDAGYEAVRELTRALDAPTSAGGLSDADFAAGIRRRMNVDSALWHLAGTSILAHYDSYYVGKNYYLFAGDRDPRFSVIVWDLGLAFGTFGYREAGNGGRPGGGQPGAGVNAAQVDPFAQATAASRPLIRRLLGVPELRADYLAHYRTLLHRVFVEESVAEIGQSYQDLIRDAVQAEVAANGNVSGSFTFDQFLANLREPVTSSGGGGGRPGGRGFSPPGLLAMVRDRRAYLLAREDMQLPDLRLASRSLSPEAPAAGAATTVYAGFAGAEAAGLLAVELRYRVSGGFEEVLPMAEEGGTWSAVIPAQRAGRHVTYALRAGLAGGQAAFFPEANWTAPFAFDIAGVDLPVAPSGDLVLNELQADNAATLADEAGEFEDWVEIYNRGAAPLALGGLYLSDDPQDPWAFALPERTLAPGEHVLVWCDGDLDQGPLHAPFKLDRQGESVVITSRQAILDRVDFPTLATDQSFGRRTDGATDWALCGPPTPGQANACDGRVPEPTRTPVPTRTPEPTSTRAPINTPVPSSTVEPTRARVYLPSLARGE